MMNYRPYPGKWLIIFDHFFVFSRQIHHFAGQSFCRFSFLQFSWLAYHFAGFVSLPRCELIILEVWIRTRHWKTINFVVKLQVMLHQFSTIRALLLSIFHKGQCNMYDILPQKPKPALIQNSNTKTNGRNRSVVL